MSPRFLPPRSRLARMLSLLLVARAHAAPPPAPTQPATAPASRPAKTVAFQPGIRFDWTHREVLADATVILREGLIELFACSPRQREHEAIVRLEARPQHLYQALGLIGLRPGHPIRVHQETEKIEPAVGDPVEIDIRCERDGRTVQEPIEAWMRVEKTRLAPARLPWVFAGSVHTGNGFAADAEGTVIALVDFGSSLLALPEQHSAGNEELWLAPATERIPPLGTACVLVFRAGPLRIEMDRVARITLNGQVVTRAELARRLSTAVREDPATRVDLRVDPACPDSQREGIEQLLRLVGIRPGNLTTTRPAVGPQSRHDPRALRAWMARGFGVFPPPGDATRPDLNRSVHRLLDDLHERGLLLRARAQGLSASLEALAEHINDFMPPAGDPVRAVDHEPSR